MYIREGRIWAEFSHAHKDTTYGGEMRGGGSAQLPFSHPLSLTGFLSLSLKLNIVSKIIIGLPGGLGEN